MNNRKFQVFLTSMFVVVLVGCAGNSASEIISETPTPRPTVVITPTLEPTPTSVPVSLEMNFLWEWVEIIQYLGEDFQGMDEFIEESRNEKSIFYYYFINMQKETLLSPQYPFNPDFGSVAAYLESIGRGIPLVDSTLFDKVIYARDAVFYDPESPLYQGWYTEIVPEEDGVTARYISDKIYDRILFITVENDYDCVYWKEGGVNVVDQDGTVSFFEDSEIPFKEFNSEEIEMIKKGYTLIDRREEPFVSKCNFFDFMEEITSTDGS